ncbi:MAG: ribbon-helix-helix protein, CopG family [Mycobacterium sp.]
MRLAAELDGRLVEYAEQAHVSPSEIMRRALDDYLRRLGA